MLHLIFFSLTLADLAGSTKRATGQAIQIAMGNLAGGEFPLLKLFVAFD
jgi:hypothetical protein